MKTLKILLVAVVGGFAFNVTTARASFLNCKSYNGSDITTIIIETGTFKCEDDRGNIYYASLGGISAGLRYAHSNFSLHCPSIQDYNDFFSTNPYFAVDVFVGFGFGVTIGSDLCSIMVGDSFFSLGASVGAPFLYISSSEEDAYNFLHQKAFLPAQMMLNAKNKAGEDVGLFALKTESEKPEKSFFSVTFSNHEGVTFWGYNVRAFGKPNSFLHPKLKEKLEPRGSAKYCGGAKCLVMDSPIEGKIKWRMIGNAGTWHPEILDEGTALVPQAF